MKKMDTWMIFALSTVACWGLYGIALHQGSSNMGDKVAAIGRYKAFFLVGIMYFIFAVVAPAILLIAQKASWTMPSKAIAWSSFAGILGAAGAFGVLLAFGAGGKPPAVMSIVFAGAPILNSVVAMLLHPPAGGFGAIRPQFYLGVVMAAVGAFMVVKFKPADGPAKPHASAAVSSKH